MHIADYIFRNPRFVGVTSFNHDPRGSAITVPSPSYIFFLPLLFAAHYLYPSFSPYPLRTCWLLRRFLSTSSSLWLFAFVPVSAVGVVCLCLFTCGERNGKGHVCVRVLVLGVWHVRASSANVELFLPFATYPLPASSHATLFPPSFVPAFERRLLAREPDDGVDADTGRQNARRPFRHSTRFTDRYYRSSLVSERVHQPHPRQYPPLHHRSTLAPLMEHRDRRLNLLSCRFSDLRTIRVRDEYQFFPRLPFVSHPDGCPLVRVNVQNRQNDAYFIRIKGSMTLRSFRVIHSVSLPLSPFLSLSLLFSSYFFPSVTTLYIFASRSFEYRILSALSIVARLTNTLWNCSRATRSIRPVHRGRTYNHRLLQSLQVT